MSLDLIDIPGNPRVVLAAAMPAGSLRDAVATAAAKLGPLRERAAEIHAARGLLPSEVAAKLAALKSGVIGAMASLQRALQAERDKLARLQASNPVQGLQQASIATVIEDGVMAMRLAQMSDAGRTEVFMRAIADPGTESRWVNCLLRLSPEATALGPKLRAQLLGAAREAFTPEAARAIEGTAEAIKFGDAAVRAARLLCAQEFAVSASELDTAKVDAPAPSDLWTDAVKKDCFDALPPHIKADLLGGGKRASQVEIQLALDRQRLQ